MLFDLLRLMETSTGPVTLSEIQARLGVDQATLEAMLDFWVRKGRLHVDGRSAAVCGAGCADAGCSCGSCSGVSGCPFIARMPRAYEVAVSQPIESNQQ